MNQEDLKLEILKEFQRQMLIRKINVKDVYEIGNEVRKKFDINFGDKSKEEIIEDARRIFD